MQSQHWTPLERLEGQVLGYHASVAHRYLAKDSLARRYLETVVKERHRLEVRGSMLPSELIRPKSYAYVNFQLGAFARLAIQSQELGVDLWRYRAEEKNSILVRAF